MQAAPKSRSNLSFKPLLNLVLAWRSRHASSWINEDFRGPDQSAPPVQDPWRISESRRNSDTFAVISHPAAENAGITSEKNGNSTATFSWFEHFPESNSEVSEHRADDWASEAALPLFIPNAATNPFDFDTFVQSKDDHIQRRSRWLTDLLDIFGGRERRYFTLKFNELFSVYSGQSTFKKLAELALDGFSADDIWLAYELKEIWSNTPVWWVRRGRGVAQFWNRSLSWTRAAKLCARRKGLPSEHVIDPEWFEEWRRLPSYDPLHSSFLDFVEARVEAFDDGYLDIPMAISRREVVPQSSEYDGHCMVNYTSRTGNLARCRTDGWSITPDGTKRNNVLTPKRTVECRT